MKKYVLLFVFLILTSSVFGQQFLWSTERDKAERYVPLNNVTREVLTFYDQYDLYYDFSGFSKDRFIKMFDYGFEDWSFLYDIEKLTVFALRSNTGRGSIVLVMCISKDNVNTLIFTNTPELGRNWIMTYSSDRDKFSQWFKTIMN
ncbi:MAG: hypothetical protein LBB89_05710 [Treponema sp.]|jgi:hypothetical protein|nr:hypothetical protein [Treponema sp.]